MDLSLHPTLIPVPKSLMLNTRPSFTSGSRKAKPSHGTPRRPLAAFVRRRSDPPQSLTAALTAGILSRD
jgi:hypothetical protein